MLLTVFPVKTSTMMETDKSLIVEQCFKFNYSPDFKLGSNEGERLYKENARKTPLSMCILKTAKQHFFTC